MSPANSDSYESRPVCTNQLRLDQGVATVEVLAASDLRSSVADQREQAARWPTLPPARRLTPASLHLQSIATRLKQELRSDAQRMQAQLASTSRTD